MLGKILALPFALEAFVNPCLACGLGEGVFFIGNESDGLDFEFGGVSFAGHKVSFFGVF